MMKPKALSMIMVLAVAITALIAPQARANLPYANGDILLGFNVTGGTGATTDYEVNLGSASQFFNATTPFTLSFNLGADLASIYGSTWFNRADLFWGAVGQIGLAAALGRPASTLYATEAPGSSPFLRGSKTAQDVPAGKIRGEGSAYGQGRANGEVESSTVTGGLFQPTTVANSYKSFQPGGANTDGASAYSFFVPSIQNSFGAGSAGATLNLYELQPDTTGTNPAATLLGALSINDSGVMMFTPAAAVPEPSTFAFMVLGGGGLVGMLFLRRRTTFSPR